MCTCGHSFITGKRKQNSLFRSSPRCRGCGATRKRHVCTAKPEAARLKCLRSRSPKATSNKNEKPSTPSASLSNKPVSKKKSVNRVKCTACVIRKTISTLIKNCDVAEVNVVSLEADLTNIVDQVKVFQVTIANELQKVKQLIQTLKAKTSTTSTSKKQNVFDLMRLASKKAVAPNTPSRKQQPKQSRGAQVKAGLVASQDRLNNQFLVSLVQGQVTLQVPEIDHVGRDIRPVAISKRHTVTRRLDVAKRGFIVAAQTDGATLVWVIRALYKVDGLRQAFDVALLTHLRVVSLLCCLS